MYTLLVVLMLTPLAQLPASPSGDVNAGETAYRQRLCYMCHGENGEGGYGPELAGRNLTSDQFSRYVRKPHGSMPWYAESQAPDSMLANIYAFLRTKPPVTTPSAWHWLAAPPTAPLGQRLYMNTAGCGQCHEPENRFGRAALGAWAKDVDFEAFKHTVYEHAQKFPNGGMPNYSRDRLPESLLKEIYTWMVDDLGLRAQMGGTIGVVQTSGDQTTYSVTVANQGQQGKGLVAEGVTIYVKIPRRTTLVSATGTGYAGVMPFTKLGLEPALPLAPHPHDPSTRVEWPAADTAFDVAVWKIPKMDAAEVFKATFVLRGPLTEDVLEGFGGSAVYRDQPGRRPAGSAPTLEYRDLRSPEKGDHDRIGLPKMPAR